MYQIEEYQQTNINGTLNIINHLLHNKHSVEKIIVASSRAIYGEGQYFCKKHGVTFPNERLETEMSNGQFDHKCKLCDKILEAEATSENANMSPLSFYGMTKQVQEQIITMYAKVLGISGYALRYQNVYGPGQSLMNPYTGIMAIFSTLARNNQTIRIFEDGKQSRDFVYIDDVIEATIKCLSPDKKGVESYNVGTGNPTSVYKVAESIVNHLGSNSKLIISGEYRSGDIRHNYANLDKSSKDLGFISKINFDDGLKKFLEWALLQPGTNLNFESSLEELSDIGLLRKAKK
jgi:dTDP-L-rhamnose 4-epimerase